MPPTAIGPLRLANRRVRELMARLGPPAGGPAAVHQDLEELLHELTRAAEWLRGVSPDSMREGELAKEVSDYRSSMERLQQMLPKIQGRLLAEKARLESERSHLGAAENWAKTSKNTL
jgi:hypothetical protein